MGVVLSFFVLVGVAAGAQSQAQSGVARISGVVVAAETGAPLSGVLVTLFGTFVLRLDGLPASLDLASVTQGGLDVTDTGVRVTPDGVVDDIRIGLGNRERDPAFWRFLAGSPLAASIDLRAGQPQSIVLSHGRVAVMFRSPTFCYAGSSGA